MNWNETSITLVYSSENLKNLLNMICRKENSFSQYDFSKWCDNLTMAFHDDEQEELSEVDSLAMCIAKDIECQWDLFLINNYSLKDLQNLDLSKVALPHHWFIEWLKELSRL